MVLRCGFSGLQVPFKSAAKSLVEKPAVFNAERPYDGRAGRKHVLYLGFELEPHARVQLESLCIALFHYRDQLFATERVERIVEHAVEVRRARPVGGESGDMRLNR